MKRASALSLLVMSAVLLSGFASLSLQSPVMGPVAVCTGSGLGKAYCYTSGSTTYYLMGMWMILGLVGFGSIVRRIARPVRST